MAERVLITRRGGAPHGAHGGAASLDFRGEAAGADDFGEFQVVQQVGQGVIASTRDGASDPASVRRLESTGDYRVKRLVETNIIDVGTFRVDIDSPDVDRDVPAALRVPAELAESWPHHLVQLAGPPTPEWVDRIEKQGIDVAEPISRYALFVHAQPAQVAALRELRLPDAPSGLGSFVTWTGPFHPAYRLSRELRRGRGKVSHLLVSVYPDEQAPATRQAIASQGWQVVDEWGKEGRYRDRFAFLVVQAGRKAAARIALLPYVRSVESYSLALSPDSERSAQIIAARLDGTPPPDTAPVAGYRAFLTSCGLDGKGVTVGICDSGVDTNNGSDLHPDLTGRLAFFANMVGSTPVPDETGHGTHVAGVAVGSGASGSFGSEGWTLGLGVAPAASFGVINALHKKNSAGTKDVARYAALMVAHGAHVMNNSWKQGPPGGYTSRAAEVDGLARDPSGNGRADEAGDYLVMVFSAGNAGPKRSSITEPKEAKNPIIVGSSVNWNGKGDDIRGVASGSSRGPARDGRILPTVVAPGERVVSARSRFSGNGGRPLKAFTDAAGTEHEDHAVESGTSTAAPHVTGACALLIQWWRSNHGGQNPSLAMLKALLVNGAEDLAGGPSGRKKPLQLGHIPDPDQGWGRVCIQNILAEPKIMQDQERPFTSAGGEGHAITVRADDPGRPLKVTLAWTDVPGSAITMPALVNDLDLEVEETLPDGTRRVYKGNNFVNGFSVPDTVPGKGDYDSLNNVECVYIRSPAGTYVVSVLPHTLTGNALPPFDLTSAYQDYALVIDNAVEVPPE